MSEVECAGSVETSSTRWPRWLAASANADGAGRLADAALAAEEDDLAIEEAGQQHGRLPSGECSIPIRRCHW